MRRLIRMVPIFGLAFALAGCGPSDTPATVPAFDKSKSGAAAPPAPIGKSKAGFE